MFLNHIQFHLLILGKRKQLLPGDTSGAFGNDNGDSLRLNFWLGGGTDWTSGTLGTTWHTTQQTEQLVKSIADNTANECYITGVQLEAGTTASDFEFLPYDVNLARCQRYYHKLLVVVWEFIGVQCY
jgi:hypothetical protein